MPREFTDAEKLDFLRNECAGVSYYSRLVTVTDRSGCEFVDEDIDAAIARALHFQEDPEAFREYFTGRL